MTMDRTTWQFGSFTINILLVGLVYQGVAFPLFWTLLDKKGHSNTAERIALMERVLQVVSADRIGALTADREFIGQPWFRWLKQQHIPFAIRIRENAQVPSTTQRTQALRRRFDDLPIQHRRILRKPRLIYGHRLYVAALRLAEKYLIVVSFYRATGRWRRIASAGALSVSSPHLSPAASTLKPLTSIRPNALKNSSPCWPSPLPGLFW